MVKRIMIISEFMGDAYKDIQLKNFQRENKESTRNKITALNYVDELDFYIGQYFYIGNLNNTKWIIRIYNERKNCVVGMHLAV